MPIGVNRSQYIGNRDGFVAVPYVFGDNDILDHLNTNYRHFHAPQFCYPSHADDILLTSGTGAWDLTGAITEVIPASGITGVFDLHWINISSISANGTVQVDIYSGGAGAEVLISSTKATRTTVTSPSGPQRIQIPQQTADTRISCRLSDGTAGSITCLVSFEGHLYS